MSASYSESSSPSPRKPAPPPAIEPEVVLRPERAPPAQVGELVGRVLDLGDDRPYVLEGRLGRGGMGEVYLATRVLRPGVVERVAMKVVRRDMVQQLGEDPQQFHDEAELHMELNHPNVVRAHCLLEKDGIWYLMMDYLEGKSLRALLEVARYKGRRLSEPTICYLFAQVAEALDYVHRATDSDGEPLHIVHRDVSPSNIFITWGGEAKLLDFGVAWSTLPGRLETRSKDTAFKGKLLYLSPEQANRQKLDGRSDLFSLGSVLVEAGTGFPVFDVGTDLYVLGTIQTADPDVVEAATRGLPDGLRTICRKLLAREPGARYATGKDVADALRAYARERGYRHDAAHVANELVELELLEAKVSPPPPPSPRPAVEPQPGPVKRSGSALVAIAAFFAGILLGLLVSFFASYLAPAETPRELTPMPSPTPLNEENEPAVSRSTIGVCFAVGMAGAMAATSGCSVHVTTGTASGDCSFMPAKTVKGQQIPADISVTFVSLNGEGCKGTSEVPCDPTSVVDPVCWYEPCPAGDGALVVRVPDYTWDHKRVPNWLRGARLSGQARFVAGRGILNYPGELGRKTSGRMQALFTEMQLSDGTKAPICGVLFDHGEEEDTADKEGVAVLDPTYHGSPAVPSALLHVRLYWPP